MQAMMSLDNTPMMRWGRASCVRSGLLCAAVDHATAANDLHQAGPARTIGPNNKAMLLKAGCRQAPP